MSTNNPFIEFGPSQLVNVKQVAVFREVSYHAGAWPGLCFVSADGYEFASAYTERYVKNFGDLIERLAWVLGSDSLIVLQDPRVVIVKEHIIHVYSQVSKEGSSCRIQMQSGLEYAVHSRTYDDIRAHLRGERL